MASTTPQLQPQGPPVAPSGPSKDPERITLTGSHAKLIPLQASHAAALYAHIGGTTNAPLWTYMMDSGSATVAELTANMASKEQSVDPLFWTIELVPSGELVGQISLMRNAPEHRCIEVGSVLFSSALQRTRAATEVYATLFAYAFEALGVRRLEWKCNALNGPSRRAAARLGFSFEGVFRQHMIVKGCNRDTAWFAMMDYEWPEVKDGMKVWLDDSNFHDGGQQRRTLEECRVERLID